MVKTVLVTGANGDVGRTLVPALAGRYRLRLGVWELDHRPIGPDFPAGADLREVQIEDPEAVRDVTRGVDAVVHLAGQRSTSATWEQLRGPNIEGVHQILDAARRNGVAKVILASSNHATGYLDQHECWPIADGTPPRADSLYGVSKAFAEVLGQFAADYWGLAVICLRIGWVLERPHNEMALRMWLSPADLGRLVIGALETDRTFGIYYGVSANQRCRWDLSGARRDLAYEPQDDSEEYAAQVENASADGVRIQGRC